MPVVRSIRLDSRLGHRTEPLATRAQMGGTVVAKHVSAFDGVTDGLSIFLGLRRYAISQAPCNAYSTWASCSKQPAQPAAKNARSAGAIGGFGFISEMRAK